MLNFDDVFDRFCFYARLEEPVAEKYEYVVTMCIEQIHKLIREDIVVEDNKARLIEVASTLAYYKYALINNMTPQHILSVDININVDGNKRISAAKRLYYDALIGAKDLLYDDFIFEGM